MSWQIRILSEWILENNVIRFEKKTTNIIAQCGKIYSFRIAFKQMNKTNLCMQINKKQCVNLCECVFFLLFIKTWNRDEKSVMRKRNAQLMFWRNQTAEFSSASQQYSHLNSVELVEWKWFEWMRVCACECQWVNVSPYIDDDRIGHRQ